MPHPTLFRRRAPLSEASRGPVIAAGAGFGWEVGKAAAKEAVEAGLEVVEAAPSAAERLRKERERRALERKLRR